MANADKDDVEMKLATGSNSEINERKRNMTTDGIEESTVTASHAKSSKMDSTFSHVSLRFSGGKILVNGSKIEICTGDSSTPDTVLLFDSLDKLKRKVVSNKKVRFELDESDLLECWFDCIQDCQSFINQLENKQSLPNYISTKEIQFGFMNSLRIEQPIPAKSELKFVFTDKLFTGKLEFECRNDKNITIDGDEIQTKRFTATFHRDEDLPRVKKELDDFKLSVDSSVKEDFEPVQRYSTGLSNENTDKFKSATLQAFSEVESLKVNKADLESKIDQIVKEAWERDNLRQLVLSNKIPGREFKSELLPHNFKGKLVEAEFSKSEYISLRKIPNLLLHNLDTQDQSKLDKVNQMTDSINKEYGKVGILIGPSGCGKTRTAFEYLSVHFGIYLVASTSQNGGSTDLELLLSKAQEAPLVAGSIFLVKGLESIIAIRIMFLRAMKRLIGDMFTPFHWMIVQERPALIFEQDIFAELSVKFYVALSEATNRDTPLSKVKKEQNNSINLERSELGQLYWLPVFIDESQVFSNINNRFCSATHLKSLKLLSEEDRSFNFYCKLDRTALSPVIYLACLLRPLFMFIFSGTGLKIKDLEQDSTFSIAKAEIEKPVYITPGSFSNFDSFANYVRIFLPSLSEQDLRMSFSYLKGRYRFAAFFVALSLLHTDRKVMDNLNHVVAQVQENIIKSLGGSNNGTIREFISTHEIVQKLMYHYYWTKDFYPVTSDIDNAVLLIEHGLTLVKIPTVVNIHTYGSINNLIEHVQIYEPMIFEILHSSLSPPQEDFYFKVALRALREQGRKYPSIKGFLSDKAIAVKLVQQIQDRQITIFEGNRLLNRSFGKPFAINCTNSFITKLNLKSYTFQNFIEQDFGSPNCKFLGIFPEQSCGLPDFAVVLQDEHGRLHLVLVEVKNTQESDRDDASSVRMDNKSPELVTLITQKFAAVHGLLIQCDYEFPYSEDIGFPVLRLDQLGICKQDQNAFRPTQQLVQAVDTSEDIHLENKADKKTNYKSSDPQKKSKRTNIKKN